MFIFTIGTILLFELIAVVVLQQKKCWFSNFKYFDLKEDMLSILICRGALWLRPSTFLLLFFVSLHPSLAASRNSVEMLANSRVDVRSLYRHGRS